MGPTHLSTEQIDESRQHPRHFEIDAEAITADNNNWGCKRDLEAGTMHRQAPHNRQNTQNLVWHDDLQIYTLVPHQLMSSLDGIVTTNNKPAFVEKTSLGNGGATGFAQT